MSPLRPLFWLSVATLLAPTALAQRDFTKLEISCVDLDGVVSPDRFVGFVYDSLVAAR